MNEYVICIFYYHRFCLCKIFKIIDFECSVQKKACPLCTFIYYLAKSVLKITVLLELIYIVKIPHSPLLAYFPLFLNKGLIVLIIIIFFFRLLENRVKNMVFVGDFNY